jgi:hypothetical protein
MPVIGFLSSFTTNPRFVAAVREGLGSAADRRQIARLSRRLRRAKMKQLCVGLSTVVSQMERLIFIHELRRFG